MASLDSVVGQALSPPLRNNFFYGKLMDAAAFRREQAYFNTMRWLLNLHLRGSGVVFGLEVSPPSKEDLGAVANVSAGLAIDDYGREIIVPQNVTVWSDSTNTPTGSKIVIGGAPEIYVAYREFLEDAVPVLVPDCDKPGHCEPGTVREGFAFQVCFRPFGPGLGPQPPDVDFCPPPTDPWLYLGQVPASDKSSPSNLPDPPPIRRTVPSHMDLAQKIAELEARISQLEPPDKSKAGQKPAGDAPARRRGGRARGKSTE